MATIAETLRQYPAESRGFLPSEDPHEKLPQEYQFLDELAHELPQMLENKTLRPTLDKLDPVGMDNLQGLDLHRAFMIYGFLASGYVHSVGEEPVKRIPKGVAVPLYQLAQKFDKPPILSYDSYDLYNWKRKDPNATIEVDNLETLITFTRLPDEPRFILVHTEIEAEAGPAKDLLPLMQQTVGWRDNQSLYRRLYIVKEAIGNMVETQKRMLEGNSPEVFYKKFRPYIFSFENVVYEGVDEFQGRPQSFRGETGAQSSIMPSLDAALGVIHRQTEGMDHITDMRRYMPWEHREFIKQIENGPSIRDYIASSGSNDLKEVYDACLDNMGAFRDQHFRWADMYINQKVSNPLGTGRTHFMEWLALIRDETLQAKFAI